MMLLSVTANVLLSSVTEFFLAEDTGLEPVSGFPRLFSKEIPYQLG